MPDKPSEATTAYLTPQQVADRLQVHVNTVYSLCASGNLPSVILGGRRLRRISATALEAYLDKLAAVQAAEVDSGGAA